MNFSLVKTITYKKHLSYSRLAGLARLPVTLKMLKRTSILYKIYTLIDIKIIILKLISKGIINDKIWYYHRN